MKHAALAEELAKGRIRPTYLIAGPEPLLRGCTVQLLLVPPRSSRIDPGHKRLTTAEVSMAVISVEARIFHHSQRST